MNENNRTIRNIVREWRKTNSLEITVAQDVRDCEFEKARHRRLYFESVCLCVKNGNLKALPESADDSDAVEFYENNCKCSCNYKYIKSNQ